jgi:hypothetical protein
MEKLFETFQQLQSTALTILAEPDTYIQLSIIVAIYALAYFIARQIKNYFSAINEKLVIDNHPIQKFFSKVSNLVFPLLVIFLLKIGAEISHSALAHNWLVKAALTLAVLLIFIFTVDELVDSKLASKLIKWIGTPILFLHLVGSLSGLISILESVSITLGNIEFSLYGVV